jgi:hypothetical protein
MKLLLLLGAAILIVIATLFVVGLIRAASMVMHEDDEWR